VKLEVRATLVPENATGPATTGQRAWNVQSPGLKVIKEPCFR
jgi:hypothetical protein